MKNRFSFLVLLLILGSCNHQAVTFNSVNFELVQLADGVYGCIHRFGGKAICNAGIIDNGRESMIFDCFLSPDAAKELLAATEELDLSPLRYVVNSHSHNDHIRGNQVFSEDIRIISTTKTKELIEKWEPLDIADEKKYAPGRFQYYDSLYTAFQGDTATREYQQILMWRPYYRILANSHNEISTRLPDLFVDDFQSFDGPNRRVQLISKGPGHTESDLVLYLPDDQILFSGDLIFNECHPYVAHGSIPDWQNWLAYLNSLDIQSIIPGHGQIGSNLLITQMEQYLTDLNSLAGELHDQKDSIQDFSAVQVPVDYQDWWFDRFFPVNLQFAYDNHQSTDD